MSDDERTIREWQQTWMGMAMRGDVAGMVGMLTEDVVFLTPGREPFGREDFARQFEAGRGKMTIAGTADFDEVVVVGEVAYGRGKLRMEMTMSDGTKRRMAGYTLSVFRREGGVWKLARDANLVQAVE